MASMTSTPQRGLFLANTKARFSAAAEKKKDRSNKTRETFLKISPLQKFGHVLPS
jgi:hypothetical protein